MTRLPWEAGWTHIPTEPSLICTASLYLNLQEMAGKKNAALETAEKNSKAVNILPDLTMRLDETKIETAKEIFAAEKENFLP
jgi:hypothetical protein